MKSLIAILALAFVVAGCGQGEVSVQDQQQKVAALRNAEQASQSKDGVKSE